MTEDHARLLAVSERWRRLYEQEREMAAGWQARNLEIRGALEDELGTLRTQLEYAADAIRGLAGVEEELGRARALISWIDGMCVDEAPHAEIQAAIARYWEAAATTGDNDGD